MPSEAANRKRPACKTRPPAPVASPDPLAELLTTAAEACESPGVAALLRALAADGQSHPVRRADSGQGDADQARGR